MTDMSTNHAAEIAHDTKLLDLLVEVARAQHATERQRHYVKLDFVNGRRTHDLTRRGEVRNRETREYVDFDTVRQLASPESQDRLQAAVEAEASARLDVALHEDDYTGWTRFFLVTSSTGHVHSSLGGCSTCRPTTTYAPVPALSGSTEAEAVEVLGETLCTVCFPTAPTATSKLTKADAETLTTKGTEAFLARLADRKAAPAPCEGSGTWNYDSTTARKGYVSGNAATCDTCGERITLTASNKLRTHPKKEA